HTFVATLPTPPPPSPLFPYTTLFRSRLLKGYKTKEFPALSRDGTAQLDQPEVRFDLGMGYLTKELPQEAMAQFEKALAAEPSYLDRKSTRLNSSHVSISYAVFCLKKK